MVIQTRQYGLQKYGRRKNDTQSSTNWFSTKFLYLAAYSGFVNRYRPPPRKFGLVGSGLVGSMLSGMSLPSMPGRAAIYMRSRSITGGSCWIGKSALTWKSQLKPPQGGGSVTAYAGDDPTHAAAASVVAIR